MGNEKLKAGTKYAQKFAAAGGAKAALNRAAKEANLKKK
jgi:hypothetical protein